MTRTIQNETFLGHSVEVVL